MYVPAVTYSYVQSPGTLLSAPPSKAMRAHRRAFSRLLDRVLKVKEDLTQLKEDKKELLRATYAAVRGDKTPGSAISDSAVFGRDGAFRVSHS